ncbi:MAG: iron-sulfur cluster assembly protein [Candidatus Odinarchaeota archaeon]
MVSKEEVIEVLKTCYDPEIPVNIVDLGLIYDVQVKDNRDVYVKMTLTAPGCPMHSIIANDVRNKLSNMKNIGKVSVQVVWDPPWSPDMMSPTARKILGF